MQYFGLRFTFSPVSRQKLASFCRETAIRRRSNPSLTVGALMVSLKLRDLESEPRPLGSVLTRGNRVSRQKLAREYVEGHVHANGMENFWSHLKRTIYGTYIFVMPFHLFRYLDEQSFRFNNRDMTDALQIG